ncbi:uncharacterized protein KNAG_0E00100 [Huiozyma naganishii CBS 8797]|uniref:Uncharacterized protein n=1 Tax=Huiozyma naganishii (strain ATCC MYA-139 / BCRC 22969 / CBS 8797 / KCTC 17520 / NBRC 10181 / NCYC 3082 / Yp74L-3) TaxID=1071383 RepID=J7RL89_HUIN7|nr:hypothetical protein KNAG_0E00100 [Kazachstania naganishii CBS 8797]CCK70278.1 hypothetical protein KNAG_0E00100 [Kazachstania naganishii CBS 8797]
MINRGGPRRCAVKLPNFSSRGAQVANEQLVYHPPEELHVDILPQHPGGKSDFPKRKVGEVTDSDTDANAAQTGTSKGVERRDAKGNLYVRCNSIEITIRGGERTFSLGGGFQLSVPGSDSGSQFQKSRRKNFLQFHQGRFRLLVPGSERRIPILVSSSKGGVQKVDARIIFFQIHLGGFQISVPSSEKVDAEIIFFSKYQEEEENGCWSPPGAETSLVFFFNLG